jgi:hypothetical protein
MIEDGIDVGDTLEANQEATEIKVEGYAKIIRILEGHAEVHAAEIKRLQANKQTYENAAKRLKQNIFDSMIATGKRKIEGRLFKFSIAKNPQSVKVLDETKIPKKYFVKQAPTLDVKGISELLKSGIKVRGVQLQQGESLRIK